MILVQVGQPNQWKNKHSPTDTQTFIIEFSPDFIFFSSALLQHILFFNIHIFYIFEPSQKVIGESLVQQKNEYDAHSVTYIWASLYFTHFYCANWLKQALHLDLH